ncbi:hypothetical protein [Luteimonas sp. e5]
MRQLILPTLITIAMLAGCRQDPPAPAGPATTHDDETHSEPALNQQALCVTNTVDGAADACQPGQRVAFLPNRWGNEQLPVLFAALHCDLRYSVVLTDGAVTCIYIQLKDTEEDETPETEDETPEAQ